MSYSDHNSRRTPKSKFASLTAGLLARKGEALPAAAGFTAEAMAQHFPLHRERSPELPASLSGPESAERDASDRPHLVAKPLSAFPAPPPLAGEPFDWRMRDRGEPAAVGPVSALPKPFDVPQLSDAPTNGSVAPFQADGSEPRDGSVLSSSGSFGQRKKLPFKLERQSAGKERSQVAAPPFAVSLPSREPATVDTAHDDRPAERPGADFQAAAAPGAFGEPAEAFAPAAVSLEPEAAPELAVAAVEQPPAEAAVEQPPTEEAVDEPDSDEAFCCLDEVPFDHSDADVPHLEKPRRKSRAAVTLRLEPKRYLRLKIASAQMRKTSQQILTEALDHYLQTVGGEIFSDCSCLKKTGPVSQ